MAIIRGLGDIGIPEIVTIAGIAVTTEIGGIAIGGTEIGEMAKVVETATMTGIGGTTRILTSEYF
jgi:hypothetical protein